MLDSAALGLKALFQCVLYVLWAFIYVWFTQILPWMYLSNSKVAKKYPKMWLAMAIVMILAWLFLFVLLMDTKATGVIRYPIMSPILILIALGIPFILMVVILIKDLPNMITLFKKALAIRRDLEKKYDFNLLKLDQRKIAKYIAKHPDQSPLELLYEGENGKLELDYTIRKDLSSLIGFVLHYEVNDKDDEYAPDGDLTSVVLFKTIKKNDLSKRGVNIGIVRRFAREKIHSEAKIINGDVACAMWNNAQHFYTMKSMLDYRGFHVPGIMWLSSCEDSVDDNSTLMDSNFSNGTWQYFNRNNMPCFVESYDIWLRIDLTKVIE